MKKNVVVYLVLCVVLISGTFVVSASTDIQGAVNVCENLWGGNAIVNGSTVQCVNITDRVPVEYHKCTQYVNGHMRPDTSPTSAADWLLVLDSCGYTELPANTVVLPLDKKGVAKITMMPAKSYLGGNIRLEGKGAPSFLRLKANGVTYKLPVVPSSIKQLGNGSFITEFYTVDPFTSQPLVAPGEYRAELFGVNGPAGGYFNITILR